MTTTTVTWTPETVTMPNTYTFGTFQNYTLGQFANVTFETMESFFWLETT